MSRSSAGIHLLAPAVGVVIVSTALVAPPASADQNASNTHTWVEDSFDDFIDGTFDDGGAQVYVTAVGDIRFINQFDFNQDGAIDLVFCNTHDTVEKPDALVYWGKDGGFSPDRATPVATDGAYYNLVRDLDHDGWPDLVIINVDNGVTSRPQSFVYWGGPDGYSYTDRNEFDTFNPGRCVAADLNGDGLDDLVIPNGSYRLGVTRFDDVGVRIQWCTEKGYNDYDVQDIGGTDVTCVATGSFTSRPSSRERPDLFVGVRKGRSRIIANSDDGLDGDNPITVDCGPVTQAVVINHNDDEYDDLLIHGGPGSPIQVILGGTTELDDLGVKGGQDVAWADVDADGKRDLIVAGATVDTSVIYWGREDGYSSDHQTEIETSRAGDALATDLNADGHVDVVLAQQMNAQTFDVDTLVLWGDGTRNIGLQRTGMPAYGTTGIGAGDINRDGEMDLVLTGRISGSRAGHVPSYVYWNDGNGGFNPEHRTELFTDDNYEAAAADLNLDGHTDLIFAEQFETQGEVGQSTIFWGGTDGFNQDRSSGLPTNGPMGVSVADLNRDGYLDIVFGQLDRVSIEGQSPGYHSRIFWGEPDGYSEAGVTELPTGRTGTPVIADFDRDGWLDIVFPNGLENTGARLFQGGPDGFDAEKSQRICFERGFKAEAADLNADGWLELIFVVRAKGLSRDTYSLAYWGGPEGFSETRRLELPTRGAGAASVADLDRDGRLDVVFTNYAAGNTRQLPLYIYWGTDSGWSAMRRSELPADSGSGNVIADYNGDGWLDIAVACHRREGSRDQPGHPNTHVADSYIYWGTPDGFDERNRLELPTRGPHGMLGVDPGHIYHRGGEWLYVSSAHELDQPRRVAQVIWQGTTPDDAAIALQVRTADSEAGLETAAWVGPDGAGSWYTDPNTIAPSSDSLHDARYVQYRARFQSPFNARYPVLDRVEITFD